MGVGEPVDGPSNRLAALIAGGRFGEAARVLAGLAAAGHGASEISIWLGRIQEGRGLFDRAEASLRKAARLERRAATPKVELARLLERRGRLKEAAALLEEARGIEGGSVELWLALGRLRERMGRNEDAARDFLKAADLDPRSPVPRIDLARILEKLGRIPEAREAAVAADRLAREELNVRSERALNGSGGAGDDEGFLSLLSHSLCRDIFLGMAASGPAALERAEEVLRKILNRSDQPQARMILSDVLLAAGKGRQADNEFSAALRSSGPRSGAMNLGGIIALVEGGRFGAVESLLGLLAGPEGGGGGVALSADWSRLISVLVCAGRYPQAFALAEVVLARFPEAINPQCFQWPWWSKIPRGVAEEEFCRGELRRLEACPKDPGLLHWFAYCRAILLNGINKRAEALAGYAPIRDLRSARHAWMHQPFLLIKLMQEDFEGCIETARRILADAPEHWWARCRLAEATLALGREAEAMRELEKAEKGAGITEKREVLTWRGEVLLWLGRYPEALGKLDEAIRLGAKTFVHGWRGASLLMLGRHTQALAALDLAISLDAKDFEARLWRGEALRLAGRAREALPDLDEAVRRAPSSVWGYANRGLARLAGGDEAGLAEDFALIDPCVADFIRRKSPVPREGPLVPAEMKIVLEKGFELARGIRRPENYLHFLWMGPLAAGVGRGRVPEPRGKDVFSEAVSSSALPYAPSAAVQPDKPPDGGLVNSLGG